MNEIVEKLVDTNANKGFISDALSCFSNNSNKNNTDELNYLKSELLEHNKIKPDIDIEAKQYFSFMNDNITENNNSDDDVSNYMTIHNIALYKYIIDLENSFNKIVPDANCKLHTLNMEELISFSQNYLDDIMAMAILSEFATVLTIKNKNKNIEKNLFNVTDAKINSLHKKIKLFNKDKVDINKQDIFKFKCETLQNIQLRKRIQRLNRDKQMLNEGTYEHKYNTSAIDYYMHLIDDISPLIIDDDDVNN